MKATYILPFFNGTQPDDLLCSIESLREEGDYVCRLILVLDGGSPDCISPFQDAIENSVTLSIGLTIMYVFDNVGPGLSRNLGALCADDGPIFFLDAGDRVISGRTRTQLDELLTCDVSYGSILEVGKNVERVKLSARSSRYALRVLPFRNPYNNVTLATFKSCFFDVGGYSSLRAAEDWVLSARFLRSSFRISTTNQLLVIVDLGCDFVSRRSGLHVAGQLLIALRQIQRLNVVPSWKLSVSSVMQVLLRTPPLSWLLPSIYAFLRSGR